MKIITRFPDVIDNSMRKAFAECPMRFARRYVENLVPTAPPSVDLHFGACFAKGMEIARKQFYFNGTSSDESIEAGVEAAFEAYGNFQPPVASYKTKDRLVGAVRYYFQQWPLDDMLAPVTDGVERRFDISLPIGHPETNVPLRYAGRYDMLATDSKLRFYVVDEKTTGKISDSWVKQWDLDSQMTGYIWSVQRELPFEDLEDLEVMAQIRGISVLKYEFGHVEIPVVRSQYMIDRWYEQLCHDVHRMVAEYRIGMWDMALNTACVPYGRTCDYAMLCKSANPERLIEGNYGKVVWNPLAKD